MEGVDTAIPRERAPGRAPPLAEARTVVRRTPPYHIKETHGCVSLLCGGRGWIRTTEVGDVRFTV